MRLVNRPRCLGKAAAASKSRNRFVAILIDLINFAPLRIDDTSPTLQTTRVANGGLEDFIQPIAFLFVLTLSYILAYKKLVLDFNQD